MSPGWPWGGDPRSAYVRGMWACPEKPDRPDLQNSDANGYKTISGNAYLDYKFLKSGRCKLPSRLAFFGEVGAEWGRAGGYAPQFSTRGVWFNHGKETVSNVLFFDNHVAARKMGSFSYASEGSSNKNSYTPFWRTDDKYAGREDNDAKANNS